MLNREAANVNLRDAAKAVAEHLGQVAWWKDHLWVNGRMHDEKEAKLMVATALEQLDITHVTLWHVNSTLMHLKSLTATASDDIPHQLYHVYATFGGEPYITDGEIDARYEEACDKWSDRPIASWKEVLRLLGCCPLLRFK